MKNKKNTRKGVLTVEATLILPVFILVMFFVLSVMKLFYFHLVMQQAVQNVGLTLAQYGYVIDRVADLETFALQEDTKAQETKVANGAKNVIDSGNTMIIALQSGLNADTISKIYNEGQNFGEKVEELVDVLKETTVDEIINYLLVSAMNEAGGFFVKWMIGDYLSNMSAENSTITNITYDIFVEKGTKDILIFVYYDYNFPYFMNEPFHMKQMVRVHPWVGGKTKGIYKPLIGSKKES